VTGRAFPVAVTLLACLLAGCGDSRSSLAPEPASPGRSSDPGTTDRPSTSAAPIVGDAIAFHADPDGHDDFYLIGADEGGLRALTNMAETVAFPYWSPDGSRIAYLCCSGANASLWVMDADGSGARRLTSARAGSPSWSPDGTRLAFEDHDDGGLWVIGLDGTNARRLAADSGGPSWSPDGTRIAFISWRHHKGQDQRNELYVMSADGTGEMRLTDNEAEDVEPAWSPDSARLAFVSTRAGNPDIYVSSWDGRDPRRLTVDPAPDEGPEWSPDGSRIVFTSDLDGADPLMLGQAMPRSSPFGRTGLR